MQRILIVDDNDAIRESLTDALTDEGYAVQGACDGTEALEMARRDPPAVILLDLMMPGLDGGTVAERLIQIGCRSPVIVVSADRRVAQRSRALGVAGFLLKPFDLDALVELIHKVTQPPTGPAGAA